MTIEFGEKEEQELELPTWLRVGTVFTRRCPVVVYLWVLFTSCNFLVVLNIADLFHETARIVVTVLLFFTCVAVVFSVRGILLCSILDDLVAFCGGNGRVKEHLGWANVVARLVVLGSGIVVFVVVGCLHVFGIMPHISASDHEDELGREGYLLATLASCSLAVAASLLSALVLWAPFAVFQLLTTLLKEALTIHFANLTATLSNETLAKEEVVSQLDQHCNSVKPIFRKLNAKITRRQVWMIILVWALALTSLLEFVGHTRRAGFSNGAAMVAGLLALFSGTAGGGILQAMTAVGDHYENLGVEMSLNIKLTCQAYSTFPGASGVKLLDTFQKGHMNELSFALHHKALDGRALANTLFRMLIGVTITIVIGTLQGD